MSEEINNTDTPQEDGQDSFPIDSFLPPLGEEPLPDLVHSKVPFGAWFQESIVFGKRYFGRLFLLALIVSVVSVSTSFLCQRDTDYSCGGCFSCTKGAGLLLGETRVFAEDENSSRTEDEIDFFAPDPEPEPAAEASAAAKPESAEDEDSSRTEDEIEFFDPDPDPEPATETSAPAEPESAEDDPPSGEAGRSDSAPCFCNTCKTCNRESFRSVFPECFHECGSDPYTDTSIGSAVGTALWIVSIFFGLMSHLWGLRTVQKDNGSWQNMLFPSWKTFPKLVIAWFIFLFIMFVIIGGVGLFAGFLGTKLGSAVTAIGIFLTVFLFIFVFARYAITAHLILDRDYGPIKALNTSWEFMKSNVGTLVTGFILYALTLFVLAMIMLIPLALMLGNQDMSDPDLLCRHILSTPALFGTAAVAMILFNTLSQIGSIALASVFYLMATGQKRPGAWPRENA